MLRLLTFVAVLIATAHSTRDRLERLHISAVKCDDRADLRQSLGHGQAKSTRGAGDERNASVEHKQRIAGNHNSICPSVN